MRGPGFFHVVNHGVPRHVIDAFEAATRAFFALPTDMKRRVKRTATNSRGFADDEFTKRPETTKKCTTSATSRGRICPMIMPRTTSWTATIKFLN